MASSSAGGPSGCVPPAAGGPLPPPPPPPTSTTAKVRQFAPKQLQAMEQQARAEGYKPKSLFNRGSHRYIDDAKAMQRSQDPQIRAKGLRAERDYNLFLMDIDKNAAPEVTSARQRTILALNAQLSPSTTQQQTPHTALPRYATNPLDMTSYDEEQKRSDMEALAVHDGFVPKGRVLKKTTSHAFADHISTLARSENPNDRARACQLLTDYYTYLRAKPGLQITLPTSINNQEVTKYLQIQYDTTRSTPFAPGGPLSDHYEKLTDQGDIDAAWLSLNDYLQTLKQFPVGQTLAPQARALYQQEKQAYDAWEATVNTQIRVDAAEQQTLSPNGPVYAQVQQLKAKGQELEAARLTKSYYTWPSQRQDMRTEIAEQRALIQQLTAAKWEQLAPYFSRDEAEKQMRHDIEKGRLFAEGGPIVDACRRASNSGNPQQAETIRSAYLHAIQNTRFGKACGLGIAVSRSDFIKQLKAPITQAMLEAQAMREGYIPTGPSSRRQETLEKTLLSQATNPNDQFASLATYYEYLLLFQRTGLSDLQVAHLEQQIAALRSSDLNIATREYVVWLQVQADIQHRSPGAPTGDIMKNYDPSQETLPQRKEQKREYMQAYVDTLRARPDSAKHRHIIDHLQALCPQQPPIINEATPEETALMAEQLLYDASQGIQGKNTFDRSLAGASTLEQLRLGYLYAEYKSEHSKDPIIQARAQHVKEQDYQKYIIHLANHDPQRAVEIQVKLDQAGWHSKGPIEQLQQTHAAQALYQIALQHKLPRDPVAMHAQAVHDDYIASERGSPSNDHFAREIEKLLRSTNPLDKQEGQEAVKDYYNYLLSKGTLTSTQRTFIQQRVQAAEQNRPLGMEFLALRWQQTRYDMQHHGVKQRGPLHDRYRQFMSDPDPEHKALGRMLLQGYIDTAKHHPQLSHHPRNIAALEKMLRIHYPPPPRPMLENIEGQLSHDYKVNTGSTPSDHLMQQATADIASSDPTRQLQGYTAQREYYRYAVSQGYTVDQKEFQRVEIEYNIRSLQLFPGSHPQEMLREQARCDTLGLHSQGPIKLLIKKYPDDQTVQDVHRMYQTGLQTVLGRTTAAPLAPLAQQIQDALKHDNIDTAARLLSVHYETELTKVPRGQTQKRACLEAHISNLKPGQQNREFVIYAYLQFEHDRAQGRSTRQGPLWDEYNRIWNTRREPHRHDPNAHNLARLYFRDLEALQPEWSRRHKAEIADLQEWTTYNINSLSVHPFWHTLFSQQHAFDQQPHEPLFSPKGAIGIIVLGTNREKPTAHIEMVEYYLKGLKVQRLTKGREKEIAAWEKWATQQKKSPHVPVPFPTVPAVPIAAQFPMDTLANVKSLLPQQVAVDINQARPLFDPSGPIGHFVRSSSISNPTANTTAVLDYVHYLETLELNPERKKEIAAWRKWALDQEKSPQKALPFPPPPAHLAEKKTQLKPAIVEQTLSDALRKYPPVPPSGSTPGLPPATSSVYKPPQPPIPS